MAQPHETKSCTRGNALSCVRRSVALRPYSTYYGRCTPAEQVMCFPSDFRSGPVRIETEVERCPRHAHGGPRKRTRGEKGDILLLEKSRMFPILFLQIDAAVKSVLTLVKSHHDPPWMRGRVEPVESGRPSTAREPSWHRQLTWERRPRRSGGHDEYPGDAADGGA